jgi:hypothetical protein
MGQVRLRVPEVLLLLANLSLPLTLAGSIAEVVSTGALSRIKSLLVPSRIATVVQVAVIIRLSGSGAFRPLGDLRDLAADTV